MEKIDPHSAKNHTQIHIKKVKMKSLYGPLNSLGKKIAIPASKLVANRVTINFFLVLKVYLAILLGQGSGTGWDIESEISSAIKIIKKQGDNTDYMNIFDIGANVGHWSELMAKQLSNANYYLFEPQPACHKHIKLRNIKKMTLIPMAVSSQKGQKSVMHTVSETAGIASLHQRRDSYFQNYNFSSFEIETTTIDTIIEQNNITIVHFMKMDIEGHELEALKGAERSLKNGIIRALSFEFGSGNINSRTFFHDFWDLLNPLGYHFHRILPSGNLLPIKEYYEDLEHFRGTTNYIATLNDFQFGK